ncbi:hypothetical protein ACTVPA_09365 [Serratia bockelmannii]|uniref:hypothetical protein n=1 Tax=Serratia bockelmannii TaxID=2703793 RepID=UPI003E337710
MKRNKKLVYGIGTNDLANNIKKQQEIGLTPDLYEESRKAWNNRLNAQKNGRATVCEDWQLHSIFARWWIATHIEGWYIDKDWIVAGNNEYHPDKCVWIPNKINSLMNDGRKKATGLPKGVCVDRKYYKSQCNVDGVREGTTFSTAIDAHRQWQLWKIEEINNVLREFAFDLRLDGRVIQRMIEIRDSIQTDYNNNIETQ